MTADEIKTRFPLRAVASGLGIELPRDGVKFRSPFRPDQHPSCTVKDELFTDWTTGEHLDAIAFYAAAKNISNGDAFRALRAMAGGEPAPGKVRFAQSNTQQQKPMQSKQSPPTARPPLPPAIEPTSKLLERTAKSRDLSVSAFETARVTMGTLSYGNVYEDEGTCWILSDREAPGWEARRCDGKPFVLRGRLMERKSQSRGPGIKSWPVGIAPPEFTDEEISIRDPLILLVEGGPDYIAAFEICWLYPTTPVLPCAMLGKGAKQIADRAMRHFRNRRVSILGHDDATESILEWAGQIRAAGALRVTPIKLGFRDLNDIARDNPDELYNIAAACGIAPNTP
jgi:hypothetical protein